MQWNTIARIKTEQGRRFMVEQRTRRIDAHHGRRSDARLFEIDGASRVNIESLNSSLQDRDVAIDNAIEKIPFHLGENDEIDNVDRQ
jgi:hypothetical protein